MLLGCLNLEYTLRNIPAAGRDNATSSCSVLVKIAPKKVRISHRVYKTPHLAQPFDLFLAIVGGDLLAEPTMRRRLAISRPVNWRVSG